MSSSFSVRIDGLGEHVRVVDGAMQNMHDVVQLLSEQMMQAIGDHAPVAVFGTARHDARVTELMRVFGPIADETGKLLAQMGFPLLSGWCTGIPERVERAFVAERLRRRITGNALPRIGIHINLTDLKTGHRLEDRSGDDADLYLKAHTFDLRTLLMLALSQACIVFPGGIGSLLEFSRFLQQQQLRNYTDGVNRTIIVVGSDFWEYTRKQLEMMVEWGTVSPHELDGLNLRVVDTSQQIGKALTDHRQMVDPRPYLQLVRM